MEMLRVAAYRIVPSIRSPCYFRIHLIGVRVCTPQGTVMKKIILAGALACAIAPAFAESTPTYDLGTLAVTATRIPTRCASC